MLRQRIISACIAVPLLFAVLFVLPPGAARAVIAAVMLTAAWEWSGLLLAGGRAARLAYVVLFGALQAAVLSLPDGPLTLQLVMSLALAWWGLALLWVTLYPTPVPLLLRWVAGMLVMIPAWLALDFLYRLEPALLLFMLVIVWAADIGAYFAGKRWGRVKLAPGISPGKTWEGVLGGMLLVLALAAVRGLVAGNNLGVLLPFCLAVALLSIVGDLTVSIFKRNAGLKDSGKLFPGHGGLLDRIDSVTAAAPLFALGVSWAGLR
ncbi:MAG TPA: phosphatidate cytidylyltransferase [Woeseiaceae bacterium]|nr:phosphatidate cytidylyltransferase [Woeseiaceae bacterium]